jgi:hypothetical protein
MIILNKKSIIRFSLLFLIAATFLTGCGNTIVPSGTPTHKPEKSTEFSESLATAVSSSPPTVVVTEQGAVETTIDHCLACHTDKQSLIDTAKPQEEVVSENDGEG